VNTGKLLKLAPTLIIATVMAFAVYSINPQAPPVTVSSHIATPAASKEGGRREPGTPQAKDLTTSSLRRVRNPFVVVARPGQGSKSEADLASGVGGRVDPYLALVQGLTLNATFVQGKTQFASINGRLYERGQHLEGPGNESSVLIVTQVTPAEVVLEADGSLYRLGYPDQFTSLVNQPAMVVSGRRDFKAGLQDHPTTILSRQASRSRLP
jgi:hypothetical protein